ncbi:MAG: tetratricopeptide repeat protein, partial [Sideroxydans sp.]
MKPGRNDPCPCGSGKKFKKCCQVNTAALHGSERSTAPGPAELNQLIALFNAGQYTELESRARSLLGRYPDSGLGWKILGAALQIQGKDSLAALHKAAELLPGDAVTHYNLGNILHERGRLNEAEVSYRRALRIVPDGADVHTNLGKTLQDMGRIGEAEASYRRAL